MRALEDTFDSPPKRTPVDAFDSRFSITGKSFSPARIRSSYVNPWMKLK